jgi:hypothetical protein
VFLLFFGIISVIRNYKKTILKNDQIKNWPIAVGTILKSNTFLKRWENVPDVGSVPVWTHDFRYSFTVDNNRYASNKIVYGMRINEREIYSDSDLDDYRMKIAATYPINSSVRVYYNPDDPNECCLYPCNMSMGECIVYLIGVSLGVPFMLLLITLLLIFGGFLIQILFFVGLPALVLIGYWRKKQRKASEDST